MHFTVKFTNLLDTGNNFLCCEECDMFIVFLLLHFTTTKNASRVEHSTPDLRTEKKVRSQPTPVFLNISNFEMCEHPSSRVSNPIASHDITQQVLPLQSCDGMACVTHLAPGLPV